MNNLDEGKNIIKTNLNETIDNAKNTFSNITQNIENQFNLFNKSIFKKTLHKKVKYIKDDDNIIILNDVIEYLGSSVDEKCV
jgi:hypothetical protein